MSAEITYCTLEEISFTGLTDIEIKDAVPVQSWVKTSDVEATFHSRTGKFCIVFDAPPGSPARKLLEAMKAAVKATEEEPV